MIEIIQSMVFGYNGVTLEINNRKITGKSPNTWKVNNILPNIHGSKKKSYRKNVKYI